MTAARMPSSPLPRRQRGVVLFIALIVLVAMTLAGIGLMRSVDTGTVISGNLAFKQSTVHAGDQGIEAAYQWLLARAGTTALNNTDAASNYYSSRPAVEPDWNDPNSWAGVVALAPDAAGNTVSYLVHRMCTQPDTAYNGSNGGVPNECALSMPSGGSSTGGSMAVGAPVFQGNPQVYYRITSRVDGPRNTVSIVQAVVLISN